jgi:protease II
MEHKTQTSNIQTHSMLIRMSPLSTPLHLHHIDIQQRQKLVKKAKEAIS